MKTEIREFVSEHYTDFYNNAGGYQKKLLLSPQKMEAVLNVFLSDKDAGSNFDLPITSNILLLGEVEKPFSPLYTSPPLFRKLYLDADSGILHQEKSYFLGPTFIVQKWLDLFEVSSSQFAIELPMLSYT